MSKSAATVAWALLILAVCWVVGSGVISLSKQLGDAYVGAIQGALHQPKR